MAALTAQANAAAAAIERANALISSSRTATDASVADASGSIDASNQPT